MKTKYIDINKAFTVTYFTYFTAHGLPKISRNLSRPTFDKKYKTGFFLSNVGIKQGEIGTEKSKIALNAHVHLRTTNQEIITS